MSIELITAPPAGGKTTACIQRIQDLQKVHMLANIWVVVPDRLQAAAFRRRLACSGGALGTFVGTFGDLYRKILESTGDYIPIASPALVYRLIQDTVDDAVQTGELQHYAPLQSFPGFIQALQEIFGELKRSLVDPDDLRAYCQARTLAHQELAQLYIRYQNQLRALQWADPEGVNWLATAALEKNPQALSSIQLLVVDGFDSFSGAQSQILKLLEDHVAQLVITFPGQIGSSRPAHRRFMDDFEQLTSNFHAVITQLTEPPQLPPEIGHIEKWIFELDSSQMPASRPILLEARSPADEAREALRWIKSLVVRHQLGLTDCMIFTPNSSLYDPFLRASAEEFGIPLRFTRAESLEYSPAITSMLNLLNLPARNFNTRLLMNVLHSPYFNLRLPAETIARLELICRFAQIVEGREQWQETWQRLIGAGEREGNDLDDERKLPGLPHGAEAEMLQQVMDDFFDRVTPPLGSRSQIEWISWLEDLLDHFEFYNRASSERDQAVCDVFRETLRALVMSEMVAGERRGDYLQFLSDLQGTLLRAGVRENVPSGVPALLVGNISEARGLRCRALALLGLSEGIYPAVERPDPFLDEDLRRALNLEPRLQREQAGLFYQAVTRSDEFLLLTRPYLSDGGEWWEESPFWKAVQQLFDSNAVRAVRQDAPLPLADAASPQELLFFQAQRSSSPPADIIFSERWRFLKHAQRVLKTRRAKQPHGGHDGDAEPLIPMLLERYHPAHIWSCSRLESYATCPYMFFISTALKLEPSSQPQFGLDAAQLGSLLHQILELTYRRADRPNDPESVLTALDVVSEEVFACAPTQFGFRPSPLWDYEKAQLYEKLRFTVQALAEDGGWMPIAYELKFGIDGEPPLEIKFDDTRILIHGVIDRVDQNTRRKLRVIDYKSGGSHLDSKDLIAGRRLQLPIYALAVRDALQVGTPVEGFYWKILAAEASSLKLAKFKVGEAQGIEAAFSVAREQVRQTVGGIHAACFTPAPPAGGCPPYCSGALWCWHYEAGW
jgi:ATP-dependent helicase/nuclease subunit B